MSRSSRVTADVTLEAHNMLRDYCKKHERSKGFLLEKMIRKFCGGEEAAPATQVAVVEKPKTKRKVFIAPSLNEVKDYMYERISDDSEAEKFCDFYESKGWVVGKVKMKCWKAAVRNWLKGKDTNNNSAQGKTSGNLSACEAFING